jgi:hypothetical protein
MLMLIMTLNHWRILAGGCYWVVWAGAAMAGAEGNEVAACLPVTGSVLGGIALVAVEVVEEELGEVRFDRFVDVLAPFDLAVVFDVLDGVLPPAVEVLLSPRTKR